MSESKLPSTDRPRNFRSLLHKFTLVSSQVERGLHSVKRTATYLKKIAGYEEAFAKDVLKATLHETHKLDKHQGDGMKRFISTWIGMQEALYQNATQHNEFRSKVISGVVLPLQSFYKEAEARRLQILQDMRAAKKDVKQIIDGVAKQKQRAIHMLESYKAAKDKAEGITPTKKGFLSKIQNFTSDSLPVQKERCAAACKAYTQAVQEANRQRKKLQDQVMPQVFDDLYELEVARLDVLKEHLAKFAFIYHELVAPLEELSARLAFNAQSMNTLEDVSEYTDSWVQVYGNPPKNVPLRYDLPCSSDDIVKDRWDGSMVVQSNHNSIFNTTLEDVMRVQASKHPTATLPVVLTTLTEAIINLGGAQTEGIFRISPEMGQLEDMYASFGKGDYSVNTTNPHVPAGLLKQWLRDLSEPLIPAEFYQSCVDAAKATNAGADSVLELYQQFPKLTRGVIEHLTDTLSIIVSNSATNKMTTSNLAIVFSPSFLRCDSDDPMEMMMNSKFETAFVRMLIEALMEKSTA